jgi:hypothetical protein
MQTTKKQANNTQKTTNPVQHTQKNNAEYLFQLHKGFNSTEYNPTVDLEKEVIREQFI